MLKPASVIGLLLLSACSSSEAELPTATELLIDAEPSLRSQIARLQVKNQVIVPAPNQHGAGPEGWPIPFKIQPEASVKQVALAVRAFDAAGEIVRRTVELELDGRGQRRALTIHLTESCRGLFETCDERGMGTCLPCESLCGDSQVLQSNLPVLGESEDPLLALTPAPICDEATLDGGADAGDGGGQAAEAGFDAGRDAGDGQIADGGTNDTPREPLAVSGTHACAIRGAARTAYCFGLNDHGQLGISGDPGTLLTPVKVGGDGAPLQGVRQLAVGVSFSCALGDDGRVRCWGTRDKLQTGTRRVALAHKPYPVVLAEGGNAPDYLPLEDITQIAAGQSHACAVRKDGVLYCWGGNDYGALGIGTDAASTDGAVAVPLPDAQKARIVGIGANTTCVVTREERLFCWGYNFTGTAGEPPDSDNGVDIKNGAIRSPKELVLDAEAQPVLKLRGGERHFALFANNGSVWTWGSNHLDQLRRMPPACESAWANLACDTVPGAIVLPNAQMASEIATSVNETCVATGSSKEVSCDLKYVLRADADAGVRLGPVEHMAGASTCDGMCMATADDAVYCFGSFQRPDNFEFVPIEASGNAVPIALPE